jgi:hypothetical protein
MKNWKDFDWTDEDGNTLPSNYLFAAIDKNGDAYAYHPYWNLVGAIYLGVYQVENWRESLIHRKDYKKESDKSAFTEENFLEFIHFKGYSALSITSIINEFKRFLESRKPLPQEVTDAMAILEKHGYKFTKGN